MKYRPPHVPVLSVGWVMYRPDELQGNEALPLSSAIRPNAALALTNLIGRFSSCDRETPPGAEPGGLCMHEQDADGCERAHCQLRSQRRGCHAIDGAGQRELKGSSDLHGHEGS